MRGSPLSVHLLCIINREQLFSKVRETVKKERRNPNLDSFSSLAISCGYRFCIYYYYYFAKKSDREKYERIVIIIIIIIRSITLRGFTKLSIYRNSNRNGTDTIEDRYDDDDERFLYYLYLRRRRSESKLELVQCFSF